MPDPRAELLVRRNLPALDFAVTVKWTINNVTTTRALLAAQLDLGTFERYNDGRLEVWAGRRYTVRFDALVYDRQYLLTPLFLNDGTRDWDIRSIDRDAGFGRDEFMVLNVELKIRTLASSVTT